MEDVLRQVTSDIEVNTETQVYASHLKGIMYVCKMCICVCVRVRVCVPFDFVVFETSGVSSLARFCPAGYYQMLGCEDSSQGKVRSFIFWALERANIEQGLWRNIFFKEKRYIFIFNFKEKIA